MRISALHASTAALLLAAVAWSCSGPPAERAASAGDDADVATELARDVSPEVAELLDAGNSAYAAGDYEGARLRYREATDLEPDLAAAWFGVYMAERALGDLEAAREALSRVDELNDSGYLSSVAREGAPR